MTFIFIFILGLFLGSFFNVVIDRVPRVEGFLNGRSHCDYCDHVLSWYDLIPVFSFVLLLGKCRYCHIFIGWKYPIVEITTAFTLAISYIFSIQYSLEILFLTLGVISCLIIIFFTDLFSGIIPDMILVLMLIFSIARLYLIHELTINSFLSGLGAFLLFLLLFLVTKGKGMGFGDVKYAFVMGLILGFPVIIISTYLAFLTGGMVALILLLVGKKKLKNTIAFGPFLVLSTYACMFWGDRLWIIFLRILGL